MTVLFLDLETWSETPIRDGTFKYAENAEVMIWAWALDDDPVKIWDTTADLLMPAELEKSFRDPAIRIIIHNAMFDISVLRESVGINITFDRVHCTMAQAYAHSLPGALGTLCEVLGVPVDKAKDRRGKALIQLFCKPLPANRKLRRATRHTHPKEWAEFVDYARLDVEAMRAIYHKMPKWNYQGFEYGFWCLDQEINARGVAVDLELAHGAIRAVDLAQTSLSARTNEMTRGAVQKTTQRDKLLDHISKYYGVNFPDLTSTMVEKAVNDETLPGPVRELLALRAQASLSSTAKYRRFIKATSADGRLRGMFRYCGASRTGRDSGRVVQLQNLPRPSMAPEDIEFGIESLKKDAADLLFENPMELASNAIRGVLIAAPGKKFVIADLSNIEGRILAWLAGEKWKIQAFRDFDNGTGPDLYKLAYAKAFRVAHETVTDDQRHLGKTLELAMGYQGGVGAFVTFAEVLNVNLDALADRAVSIVPAAVLKEARGMWEWAKEKKRTYDLSERIFVVCDSLKRLWRQAHPAISSFWNDAEHYTRAVLLDKNNEVCLSGGKLKIHRNGNWVRITLPSGRSLCYPSMRDDSGLSYSGVNPYSRKWGRITTYGGKITENAVQATARDVMVSGLVNAEKSGYPVVLRAHDELVCEVPDNDRFTVEGLVRCMTEGITWAEGLPLAAKGFETYRYRKG